MYSRTKTTQTMAMTKKGKKIIIEEDVKECEFCEDIWRYIKEFLLYDSELYWTTIIPIRQQSFLYSICSMGACQPWAADVAKIHLEKGNIVLALADPRVKTSALRFFRYTRKESVKSANRKYNRLYNSKFMGPILPVEPMTLDAGWNNKLKQLEDVEAKLKL